MITRVFLIATMSCQLHFIVHAQSNTGMQDTLRTTALSYRLSFLFLSSFNYLPSEEGSKSGYNFLLGTGIMPDKWWIPAPHFYITYTHYENECSCLTHRWTNISVISFYPSIKLARFLIVGFGYSWGDKNAKYQTGSNPIQVTNEGAYSTWSPFLGIDIDLHIDQNVYISFGMYYKEPAAFYALGASLRI